MKLFALLMIGSMLAPSALPAKMSLNVSTAQAPSNAPLQKCFNDQMSLVPFSGVVLLDRDGKSFLLTTGTTDGDDKVAATADSRFRLASVQKVMTRIAIGKLVEQGLLSFDAPIGTYIKDLPAAYAGITVDQLLQHRSGVANLQFRPPPMMAAIQAAQSNRDLMNLVLREPLEFTPGERMQYSNGGFWVLGGLIEAVTGKSYGEYLETTIYKPLSMTSTNLVSDDSTAVRKTRLIPGQPPLPTPQAVRPRQEQLGNASGDGVTTANDLLKLGRALLGTAFLQDDTKQRLFPKRPGMPWRLGQSGGSMGTSTDFNVFPEHKLVSITLSNFDPPAGDSMGMVMARAAITGTCTPEKLQPLGPPPGSPPGQTREFRPGPGPGNQPSNPTAFRPSAASQAALGSPAAFGAASPKAKLRGWSEFHPVSSAAIPADYGKKSRKAPAEFRPAQPKS